METIVYLATEVFRAMEPRARTDEDTARKPLRAIVAIGSTVTGSGVIVAVRTVGRNSNLGGNPKRLGLDRDYLTSLDEAELPLSDLYISKTILPELRNPLVTPSQDMSMSDAALRTNRDGVGEGCPNQPRTTKDQPAIALGPLG
jgi:hypothetical protein